MGHHQDRYLDLQGRSGAEGGLRTAAQLVGRALDCKTCPPFRAAKLFMRIRSDHLTSHATVTKSV